MAPWAKAEWRRKKRAEQRSQLFCHVRFIFVVLLFAALYVFISDHQMRIQALATAGVERALKRPAAASYSIRTNALNYEKQVDQIIK